MEKLEAHKVKSVVPGLGSERVRKHPKERRIST